MTDRWSELAETVRQSASEDTPRDTLVINLYGGPGTGKSTVAALVFGLLKAAGHSAELVTEYAKDLVWQGRFNDLADQTYIFAKQARRVKILLGQVDYVVTDSPILLAMAYADGRIHDIVRETHRSWNTLDIFLARNDAIHPFKSEGRTQSSLADAVQLDARIHEILAHETPFITTPMDDHPLEIAEGIVELVLS